MVRESPDETDPATVFAALSRVIYEGSSFDEIYQHLVDSAPRIVAGCDHASLMVARNGDYVTVAASDDVAHRIGALEREEGDGPCVDAIEDEAGQIDADLTVHSSWPMLARRVIAESPVRGMAGFRIVVDGRKVGSLNLFSDAPGAFNIGADQGAVLAAFASVALQAVTSQQLAESLRLGLESNREIGKAVGLLMSAHEVGSEAAYQLLKKSSNDMNMKLAEVAREVVDNAERIDESGGGPGVHPAG